jgi:hypothetical protein
MPANRVTVAFSACLLCGALSVTRQASAYRPFDGTDAGVAETGHFEVELGPAHYYRYGQTAYLIAPDGVLNLGFAPHFEAVADFKQLIAESHVGAGSRASLQGTDVLVKWLAREGTLQGQSGLGLAFEGGVLTPELGVPSGVGAQLDTIVSQQWQDLTVHLNEQVALSRDHRLDLFTDVILLAPVAWPVRPASELYLERTGRGPLERSALFGAIWSANSAINVDTGLRFAREDDRAVFEFRFGLTGSIGVWKP